MNIRRAIIEDANAIYELGKSVEEFAVNNETVTFWPKELLVQAIQSEDALIFIAEDEAIVGFVIVNYNHSFKKAIIENMYVSPDKRGQGISDQLLEGAIRQLIAMGCEYVATLVPPNAQGALDLYSRNGFSQGETFMWLDKPMAKTFKRKEAEA
jgi:ribosomal protein S18 acetylase RimI-like enzyme